MADDFMHVHVHVHVVDTYNCSMSQAARNVIAIL